MSTDPTPINGRRQSGSLQPEDVATYCALPSCGREYRRAIQPGHPQLYCDETCRRKAQQETRRIRSRLRDLEATVRQQRRLLAAYGSESEPADAGEALVTAIGAVERAGGIIQFLHDESPVAAELRALYTAVAPVISVHAGTSPEVTLAANE